MFLQLDLALNYVKYLLVLKTFLFLLESYDAHVHLKGPGTNSA